MNLHHGTALYNIGEKTNYTHEIVELYVYLGCTYTG